jgi:adenylate cyclase
MEPGPVASGSKRLDKAASSSLIVEGRNVIVTEVVERTVAERPDHDTIENIIEWLIGDARQIGSFARMIDELSWRLVAAGIPLLRVNLRGGTLHPQVLGSVYVWWRSSAQTQEIMITHEVADLVPPAQKSGHAGGERCNPAATAGGAGRAWTFPSCTT